MAGVTLGSGGGARRSLDSEINMVPMIDLLMCLICFLLITAVWSTHARLNADAQVPGQSDGCECHDPPPPALHVSVGAENFRLTWRRGSAVESQLDVPRAVADDATGSPRFAALAAQVVREWQARGSHHDASDRKLDQAVIHCDNLTPYKEVVAVIDAVYQAKREFPGSNGKRYPAMNVELAMNER